MGISSSHTMLEVPRSSLQLFLLFLCLSFRPSLSGFTRDIDLSGDNDLGRNDVHSKDVKITLANDGIRAHEEDKEDVEEVGSDGPGAGVIVARRAVDNGTKSHSARAANNP